MRTNVYVDGKAVADNMSMRKLLYVIILLPISNIWFGAVGSYFASPDFCKPRPFADPRTPRTCVPPISEDGWAWFFLLGGWLVLAVLLGFLFFRREGRTRKGG